MATPTYPRTHSFGKNTVYQNKLRCCYPYCDKEICTSSRNYESKLMKAVGDSTIRGPNTRVYYFCQAAEEVNDVLDDIFLKLSKGESQLTGAAKARFDRIVWMADQFKYNRESCWEKQKRLLQTINTIYDHLLTCDSQTMVLESIACMPRDDQHVANVLVDYGLNRVPLCHLENMNAYRRAFEYHTNKRHCYGRTVGTEVVVELNQDDVDDEEHYDD